MTERWKRAEGVPPWNSEAGRPHFSRQSQNTVKQGLTYPFQMPHLRVLVKAACSILAFRSRPVLHPQNLQTRRGKVLPLAAPRSPRRHSWPLHSRFPEKGRSSWCSKPTSLDFQLGQKCLLRRTRATQASPKHAPALKDSCGDPRGTLVVGPRPFPCFPRPLTPSKHNPEIPLRWKGNCFSSPPTLTATTLSMSSASAF